MMLLCIQSIFLCFHDIHIHLKPMHASYIVLFLIYITRFIYWFFPPATCFFSHSYVWAQSILTIEYTYLFECIYHIHPLGYLDSFQIFVITSTPGMKFMIMTPYIQWERPSRELLGYRACPLGTRYWAICSSWQL